jgi:hypothetical protein
MAGTLSHRSLSFAFLAALIAATSDANAQQQDSAGLAGTVRSALNGRPIAGVMVAVGGTQMFDVTDSTGTFALVGLPSGKQTLRILYRDEVFSEQPIKLKRGKTARLAVLLDVEAVELAPVVVEAKSIRASRSLAGFYDRKKWGFGRYYTFEDLARRGSLALRALLTESGVRVRCGRGYCLPLGGITGRQCVIPLYLDGLPFPVENMDLIRVNELAAVEIYRHGLDVPWEFRSAFDGGCGAVAMWSRY